MRFVTWNIHSARGVDGLTSTTRIAEALADLAPDVIGLNEVRATVTGRQARTIARLLGTDAVFQRNLVRPPGFRFGNAILTRGRVRAYRHTPLPGQAEPRGLVMARIELDGRRFVFGSTHLGLSPAERALQLATITHALPTDEPVVVSGDFNARPNELGPLAEVLDLVEPVPSFPAKAPRSAIDLVFTSRHWRVVRTFAVETLASDHLPVVTDLEFIGD